MSKLQGQAGRLPYVSSATSTVVVLLGCARLSETVRCLLAGGMAMS